MKKKTIIVGVGVIIIVVALFIVFGSNKASGYPSLGEYDGEMTIYKTGSCGCCGVFVNYFQRKGNSDVEVVNLESLSTLKAKYEIPSQMESCHTTIIGNYFIEGHIPLEAVEKLLTEKPDIKGIAMPGMPNGSPGMPGTKSGDFVIYAVQNDGTFREWMRI
ncbi:hypothetical protein COU60_02560 [Candidatus Pacearchaeota archaeon CG10_big_fil_rev_8_21_14_0_10_34_76]|nr:MAG: hypothetical protein COU60_02560 [Candidatus Pacearchaeota archaeon CG10_big_fil_rev_8_21_14_0_10_34_76]